MKIEAGMYARCKNYFDTNIFKVAKVQGNKIYSYYKNEFNYSYYLKKDVIKASHNIIDLIQVGDYVNGHEVIDFDETYFNGVDRRKVAKRLSVIVDIDSNMGFVDTYIKNEDIKSIVTKEQFEQVSYKVGE